jgi:hypothetical protein
VAPSLIHDFPAPYISSHQLQAHQLLNDAYKHLCAQFSPFWNREQMQANIDARLLILYARDAILDESPVHFHGTTIDALTGIVQGAEKGGRQ